MFRLCAQILLVAQDENFANSHTLTNSFLLAKQMQMRETDKSKIFWVDFSNEYFFSKREEGARNFGLQKVKN